MKTKSSNIVKQNSPCLNPQFKRIQFTSSFTFFCNSIHLSAETKKFDAQVDRALHGQQRKGGKFQLLKQDAADLGGCRGTRAMASRVLHGRSGAPVVVTKPCKYRVSIIRSGLAASISGISAPSLVRSLLASSGANQNQCDNLLIRSWISTFTESSFRCSLSTDISSN